MTTGRTVQDSGPGEPVAQESSTPCSAMRGTRFRLAVVGLLVVLYLLVSLHFHLVRHESIAYSHLAYLPILLTGLWWGRRALLMAALLSGEMLAFSLFLPSTGPLWAALVRIFFYFLAAAVVGELSRRVIEAQHALCESENRLRRTNASIRTLSRMRRDFLHIAVHDMRAPVSAASMLLHSLRELLGEEVDPRVEHLVSRMHGRLDEAGSFLRDFGFFAELEDSAQLRRSATLIDLDAVLRRVAQEQEQTVADSGHTLLLELAEAVPAVAGIERLLGEVVTNLVTNAVKYTPEGGRILLRTLAPPGGFARVEVEDTGIGIAEENRRLLFREFVRLKDNEVAGRKVPGIGLGLSIVRRIVELHGGRVFLESEPGRGSLFGFDLPACRHPGAPVLPMRRLPATEDYTRP